MFVVVAGSVVFKLGEAVKVIFLGRKNFQIFEENNQVAEMKEEEATYFKDKILKTISIIKNVSVQDFGA